MDVMELETELPIPFQIIAKLVKASQKWLRLGKIEMSHLLSERCF